MAREPSSVATRRGAFPGPIRGLKPTATFVRSLRDRTASLREARARSETAHSSGRGYLPFTWFLTSLIQASRLLGLLSPPSVGWITELSDRRQGRESAG